MPSDLDDLAFRETMFAQLRARTLTCEAFTCSQLCEFGHNGQPVRLAGTQTGMWRVRQFSEAAISILTSFVPDGAKPPYDDAVGPDGLLRL